MWRKIRENDPSACTNRLYALEGAIRGMKKSDLPEDVKADLKVFIAWRPKTILGSNAKERSGIHKNVTVLWEEMKLG